MDTYNRSTKVKIVLLVLIATFSNICAQKTTEEIGSWEMLFNQTRLHNKWSLHSEVQFRSYDVKPNTEQLLIRGGINFHYNSNIILSSGYGWITNYVDDENIFKQQNVNENRIWEQLILKSKENRFNFEHRYRLEQRWIEANGITNYKNRIRYLFRITVPLNKKEVSDNTIFFSLYNELFIALRNASFDRNRLYGAIGFQINKSCSIQIGYLLQSTSIVSKQYLQIGINLNPDFRKVK